MLRSGAARLNFRCGQCAKPSPWLMQTIARMRWLCAYLWVDFHRVGRTQSRIHVFALALEPPAPSKYHHTHMMQGKPPRPLSMRAVSQYLPFPTPNVSEFHDGWCRDAWLFLATCISNYIIELPEDLPSHCWDLDRVAEWLAGCVSPGFS